MQRLVPHKRRHQVYLTIEDKTDEDKYVPSIDRFMIDAAKIFGSRVMGIILTGMGSDGVKGLSAIKKSKGVTLAESEQTAIVYGMPKEAIKKNVVDLVEPLQQIPNRIIEYS